MPKAVLFDMDGTLIDTVDLHARAWQDALGKWGKNVTFEEVRKQVGKGADQLLPVFLTKAEQDEFGERMTAWRGKHFLREYFPQAKPFPRVRELFERLIETGRKVAVASSAKGEELGHYKRLARIDDLLDAETTSDDADKSKPHPDIFLAALEKLGLPARDCVGVGDTPYDAIACSKAGIAVVGVRCGGFPEEELRRGGCAAIYDDPAGLLAHLEEWS